MIVCGAAEGNSGSSYSLPDSPYIPTLENDRPESKTAKLGHHPHCVEIDGKDNVFYNET